MFWGGGVSLRSLPSLMWKSDLNSCLTAGAITYNVHLIQTLMAFYLP